jgi:hypothetical protein
LVYPSQSGVPVFATSDSARWQPIRPVTLPRVEVGSRL